MTAPRRSGAIIGAIIGPLLLSACGTLDANRARSFIPGKTEPDVISCMGPPDSKTPTGTPGESVLGWTYTQTGSDVDVAAGIYSFQLGRPGICRTLVRFRDGYAVSAHFTYVDVSPTNPDSICGRMVHECLTRIDRTELPPGYDPNAVLTGAPIVVRQGLKAQDDAK